MIEPNFFVIGAMKSGTTSLRHSLSMHPEIFWMHPEVRFFCNNKNYSKGISWYLKHFDKVNAEIAIGDGAGYDSYFSASPHAAERMHRHFPNAKIIYLVRHPIERLVSHWAWDISNGKGIGPLSKAIESHRPLIELSLYWFQISVYRNYFADDQIQILFLDDLKAAPNDFYRQCFEFIGVDSEFIVPEATKAKNVTQGKLTDSRLLMYLRLLPGLQTLESCLSGRSRQILKKVLKSNQKVQPHWTSELKKQVEDKIVPDSLQLLEYCQRDKSLWQFEHY